MKHEDTLVKAANKYIRALGIAVARAKPDYVSRDLDYLDFKLKAKFDQVRDLEETLSDAVDADGKPMFAIVHIKRNTSEYSGEWLVRERGSKRISRSLTIYAVGKDLFIGLEDTESSRDLYDRIAFDKKMSVAKSKSEGRTA